MRTMIAGAAGVVLGAVLGLLLLSELRGPTTSSTSKPDGPIVIRVDGVGVPFTGNVMVGSSQGAILVDREVRGVTPQQFPVPSDPGSRVFVKVTKGSGPGTISAVIDGCTSPKRTGSTSAPDGSVMVECSLKASK